MFDSVFSKSQLKPKSFISIVESVRGIAAVYVVISHLLIFLRAKTYFANDSIGHYIVSLFYNYGHSAVLLFFIVSGFSIHYTSIDRPLNKRSGVVFYYFLRLRRIYPVFLLTVAITLAITYIGYILNLIDYKNHFDVISFNQIIWTLLFATDRDYIEGIFVATISTNGPLWSLSYEILYYLLYPLFWKICTKHNIFYALLVSFLISAVSIIYASFISPNHLTNVFSLYILWGLGALLAELKRRDLKITLSPVFLYLLIYILFESVWVLEYVRHSMFSIYQLTWGALFFSFMLLFIFKKSIKSIPTMQKNMVATVMSIGLLINLLAPDYLDITNNRSFYSLKIISTYLILLYFMYFTKADIVNFIRQILKPFTKLGHISYGLYIIHYPVLVLMSGIIITYKLPTYTFIIAIAVSFLLAYFLEVKFQHWAANLIDKTIRPHLKNN